MLSRGYEFQEISTSIFSTQGRKQQVSEPVVNNTEDGVDSLEAYKRIQKGGDIPIKGLQKPAPEKTASTYYHRVLSHYMLLFMIHINSRLYPLACCRRLRSPVEYLSVPTRGDCGRQEKTLSNFPHFSPTAYL